MRNGVWVSVGLLALLWAGCSTSNEGDEHDHDHDEGHRHTSSDGVRAVDGSSTAAEVVAADSARLVIHIEGRSAGGMVQALSEANVYVRAPKEGQSNHHHPDGEPDGVTNEFGNVMVDIKPDTLYVVHVEAPEFDTLVRRVKVEAGQKEHLWLTITEMIRKTITLPETGELKLTLGETPGGSKDPVTLTIEAGDLGLDEGNGEAATGNIEVVFGSWDPEVDDPSTLPSDLETADGPLYSYSMFHIEFYQGDERLNVRDGQTVRVESRVNEARRGLAAEAIGADKMNLYSLNHSTGLWVDDVVEVTYDADTGILSADAAHFSHKNYDRPGPYPANSCVKPRAVNREGSPVDASFTVGDRRTSGCGNFYCEIGDDGNVQAIAREDTNGDGVIDDDDDDPACAGEIDADGNCDMRRAVAGRVGFRVNARRKVPNSEFWQEGAESVQTPCNDHDVSCNEGGCETATILLCSPRDEACNERADCCGTDGCFEGKCAECTKATETCETTDNCCPGLSCLDFTCKATDG
ncbi:MAG: hypothetical protein VX589_15930 [Myxococcota bacterium]|nr:hypothetical protein [Myxococcota bacterium]